MRLPAADVDLEHATLMVHHSKGRSRLLPIRDDLVRELRHYVEERQRLVNENQRRDPTAFFLRLNASPLTVNAASNALRRLLRELGMKPPRGRAGPRPYALRHAFAVHRLTAWAQAGVDIHAKMPWLSAYLGHQNVLGTLLWNLPR